ncbi:MAG: 50S ribosomal protein L35 [Candidatus Wallbacteria bacterium]|nr:50S ribosomal protein L35 [Candidatus Wallbacteria bacterium]MBI4868317.1 50S ribosomal protein L35 [Candidatus Wallbacteria bacterium]
MPKMKSHRGASKRFRINKNGLIKRASAYKSHILTKKHRKRKRNLRKVTYVSKADSWKISTLVSH